MIVFKHELKEEEPLVFRCRKEQKMRALSVQAFALASAWVFGCTSSTLCEGDLCGSKVPDASVSRGSDSSESTDSDSSSREPAPSNTTPRTSSSGDSTSTAVETSSTSSEITTEEGAAVCDPQTETGCGGGTPWCLRGRIGRDGSPQEARCVECKEDVHCNWPHVPNDQSGVCVENRCVACDFEFNHGCPEETPYCVPERRETEGDAGTEGEARVSGTQTAQDAADGRRCVECGADEHCTFPGASRCDLQTNVCVGCASSEQCERLSETPVCDVATGECVQCTSEESAACGEGRVCNMVAGTASYRTCSDYEVASTGQCGVCVNDDQCLEGYKCVAERRDTSPATPTGKSYCTREAPEEGCEGLAPFVVRVSATSVNGVEGRFCTLRYATCASYVMYKKGPDVVPEGFPGAGAPTCVNDDSCGLPELADAVCVVYTDNVNRCTYACFDDYDCPRSPPVGCQGGYCSVDNWRSIKRTDYD